MQIFRARRQETLSRKVRDKILNILKNTVMWLTEFSDELCSDLVH